MSDNPPLWGELRAKRAEERAEAVLTARELMEVEAEDRSARSYIRDEYGLDPIEYETEADLDAAVRAAAAGSGSPSGSVEAEDVLGARDLREADDRGQSPKEYLKAEYSVNPIRYDSRQELLAAMQERDG
jgi:hypothetical protein